MAFPVPTSLSPSRVEAFTSCPLAFRFASIDRLPEPASIHTSKGSLVHRALELLFASEPAERTPAPAGPPWPRPSTSCAEPRAGSAPARRRGRSRLLRRGRGAGRALLHHGGPAARCGPSGSSCGSRSRSAGCTLRGIIDRLELDDDGELVVTDYKTGRPPMVDREQQRLGGVHFYAFLCEQVFGRRPARIQLLYLSTGEVIETRPSEQSIRFLPRRTEAVCQAVERACATEDFRPRTGPLCDYCAFKPWCPAFGGDPSLAPSRRRLAAGLPAQLALPIPA